MGSTLLLGDLKLVFCPVFGAGLTAGACVEPTRKGYSSGIEFVQSVCFYAGKML